MSLLPELLGSEATPHAVEWKGKRYSFSPITFGIMAEMETAHFEEAKKRLKAMEGLYSPETLEKKADALYEQYDAGEFGFLSQRGQKWVKSPAGAACLLRLSLGISDEELMPLIIARGDEIKRLMELVLSEAGLQAEKKVERGWDGKPLQREEERPEQPFRHDIRNS